MSKQFGRFRIEDEERDLIGRGRASLVYRVFDPTLSRFVAVKVLPAASESELLEFDDHRRTTLSLKHPNIVHVYEFEQQDTLRYLVMELLRGETLESAVTRAKAAGTALPLLEKVDILLHVAKGLQYAHFIGLFHGEIAPSRIMILEKRTVKIVAPERFQSRDGGKPGDILAFGRLCYELVAGAGIAAGADPPAIRSLLPECPEALDNLILRLLGANPEPPPENLDDAVRIMQGILRRLSVERAAALAGNIQPLVEAGDTKAALETIATVLELDPANAEGRIWRGYLAAQQPESPPPPTPAQRQEAFAKLQAGVQASLARQDPDGAEAQLSASRDLFFGDPAWQELWRSLDLYRAYLAALEAAQQAIDKGEFEAAEGIPRQFMVAAPDLRAAELLAGVSQKRREAMSLPPAPREPAAAAPDAEDRAKLALERLAVKQRATEETGLPGGQPEPEAAAGPPQPGLTPEERARRALAMHSTKAVPAPPGPAAGPKRRAWRSAHAIPAVQLPPRRGRRAIWVGAVALLCLLLAYVGWSFRPVRVTAAPSLVEFHQGYGRPVEAEQVEWAVRGLAFDVHTAPGWLRAAPTPNGVRISVVKTDLRAGLHTGEVTVDFHSSRVVNPRITIPVKLTVSLNAVPSSLTFSYRRFGTVPSPQNVLVAGARNAVPETDAKWLRAAVSAGGENTAILVWTEPWVLAAGDYKGEVRLKDEDGPESRVTVNLAVTEGTMPVTGER